MYLGCNFDFLASFSKTFDRNLEDLSGPTSSSMSVGDLPRLLLHVKASPFTRAAYSSRPRVRFFHIQARFTKNIHFDDIPRVHCNTPALVHR